MREDVILQMDGKAAGLIHLYICGQGGEMSGETFRHSEYASRRH